MARKWQKADSANHSNKSLIVDKGCFAIYTIDKRRFSIPLEFLSNSIFQQLFKMSEEEFGLPSEGPIKLPCDSVVMNYIVSLLKRGLAKDLETAVLNSITSYCCPSDAYFHQLEHADQYSLVCGF
ncbi:Auxin responsive SAUR protein [Corchorus olitorius]|uniref:Auxin responsive SAUR protein n=1 Tax=Corchorus olitorius TaxID=93759 RepID=A0A1R3JAW4_9ROSI|nr:Auxin responsive SAUR protein [Corchorus olitorius]